MQLTSSSYSIVQNTAHLTKAPFYGLGYRERLHEIWHLLTLARPGYIFDKIAGGKKRVALKTGHSMRTHFPFEFSRLRWARQVVYMRESCPACQGYFTCRGETTRPLPLLRSPLPSFWDKCTTSCKRSAEFCKDRSEKLVRPGRDHINRASTSHLTKLP